MNCLDFRRQVLAEPTHLSAQAISHRESCTTCRQFYDQTWHLDHRMAEAFRVSVPEGLSARILLNQSLREHKRKPVRLRIMALAATILAVLGLGLFQLSTRTPALNRALLTHLDAELEVVKHADRPVNESMVRQVLHQIQADSRTPLTKVIFAENCIIDGKLIAHFVIEEAGKQYTILLVPWDSRKHAAPIDNERWRGVITPHEAGSLAVIGDTGSRDRGAVQRVIDRYSQSIVKRDV